MQILKLERAQRYAKRKKECDKDEKLPALVLVSPDNKLFETFVIFDNGSQITFITEDFTDKLKGTVKCETLIFLASLAADRPKRYQTTV